MSSTTSATWPRSPRALCDAYGFRIGRAVAGARPASDRCCCGKGQIRLLLTLR